MTAPVGVVISGRGILHRRQPHGRLHPRCTGGREVVGVDITVEQAVRYATGRSAVYCRYPWCFRKELSAAGVNVEVGHIARSVNPPTLADIAALLRESR